MSRKGPQHGKGHGPKQYAPHHPHHPQHPQQGHYGPKPGFPQPQQQAGAGYPPQAHGKRGYAQHPQPGGVAYPPGQLPPQPPAHGGGHAQHPSAAHGKPPRAQHRHAPPGHAPGAQPPHVPPQPAPQAVTGKDCAECGAPFNAGLAACKYCKTAYPGVHGGVRCPRCADMNLAGNPQCVSCRSPLVRACIFCGTGSPLDRANCMRCGEAFVGAEERKRQRDEAAKSAQYMNMAGEGIKVVGAIASNPVVTSGIIGALGAIIDAATDD